MNKEGKLSINDTIQIPATLLPIFRTSLAVQNKTDKNVLLRTWGGIGDQICAEPTLRFALKAFKCDVTLASELPELFSHLQFKDVVDLKKHRPIYEKYIMFDTITSPDETNMVWQFFSHLLTNCVDFPSLCALRMQLPIAERNVTLPLVDWELEGISLHNVVAVHPGKHWPSKTFPKDFWDAVLKELISLGCLPVIIGANTDDNKATVDVNTDGCIDLRNNLSILQSISLLKQVKVLLTNDSSPLHMAVDGNCWIGYVATCKHPDMITHYRKPYADALGDYKNLKNIFGWRMENFGRGGMWEVVDMTPNSSEEKVVVEEVEEDLLRSWLPDPRTFAEWAAWKVSRV